MSNENGENKSERPVYNVDNELAKLDKMLNECESRLAFPVNERLKIDVDEILCFDFQSRLSSEAYGNMAGKLARYALFLQRATSRVEAKLFWIKEEIKRLVVSRLNQQNAFKDELKMALAVQENSVATRYDQIRVQYETILKNFSYQTAKINNLADRLAELQKEARYGEQKANG